MAAGPGDGPDPLLRRATVVAAFVLIGLSVFVVSAQVLGRAIIGPSYDVGDLVLPSILGTLLALLGVGTAVKLVNRK